MRRGCLIANREARYAGVEVGQMNEGIPCSWKGTLLFFDCYTGITRWKDTKPSRRKS